MYMIAESILNQSCDVMFGLEFVFVSNCMMQVVNKAVSLTQGLAVLSELCNISKYVQ